MEFSQLKNSSENGVFKETESIFDFGTNLAYSVRPKQGGGDIFQKVNVLFQHFQNKTVHLTFAKQNLWTFHLETIFLLKYIVKQRHK